MLSMPISSSFSETGCSTFSLANFFPFSTSSLLSFSKCSRNLNSEGKGQASRHAYNYTDVAVNVKWKVLGVTILFISDQVNLILTIMSRTPHRRIPSSCPPLWPCSRCRQIWVVAQFWSWSSTAGTADYRWPNQRVKCCICTREPDPNLGVTVMILAFSRALVMTCNINTEVTKWKCVKWDGHAAARFPVSTCGFESWFWSYLWFPTPVQVGCIIPNQGKEWSPIQVHQYYKESHLFGSCLPSLLVGWWFILLTSVLSFSVGLDCLSPPRSTLPVRLFAPEPGSAEKKGWDKHHFTTF